MNLCYAMNKSNNKEAFSMCYGKVPTKWGHMVCLFSKEGVLLGLWFENQKFFPKIDETAIWIDEKCLNKSVLTAYVQLKKELSEYETGKRQSFSIPYSLEGTPFRLMVWGVLNQIPFGETRTYGEIAKSVAFLMGRESMSSQAVGNAIGHNPISIIVPCHRVIGANRQLVGYAGGLDKKEALLTHEIAYRA